MRHQTVERPRVGRFARATRATLRKASARSTRSGRGRTRRRRSDSTSGDSADGHLARKEELGRVCARGKATATALARAPAMAGAIQVLRRRSAPRRRREDRLVRPRHDVEISPVNPLASSGSHAMDFRSPYRVEIAPASPGGNTSSSSRRGVPASPWTLLDICSGRPGPRRVTWCRRGRRLVRRWQAAGHRSCEFHRSQTCPGGRGRRGQGRVARAARKGGKKPARLARGRRLWQPPERRRQRCVLSGVNAGTPEPPYRTE